MQGHLMSYLGSRIQFIEPYNLIDTSLSTGDLVTAC